MMIGFLGLLLFVADETGENLSKHMRPIYLKEVETYSIAAESAPTRKLELKKDPVFEWLNPARNTQQGAIYLWLRDGRPAALACIFSAPRPQWNGRQVMHELHALDPEKLVVTRESHNQWHPQAGLERQQIAVAPVPSPSPGARLLQMRRLAQEFTGYSVDRDGKRWELRLLPTPLYRYPVSTSGVVDGALFALVSNAGTDPEVLLLIETSSASGKPGWQFACGRFSDWDLHVLCKGREVFASIRSDENPQNYNPLHTYRIYPEKIIDMEGKLLARTRPSPRGPQVIPEGEK